MPDSWINREGFCEQSLVETMMSCKRQAKEEEGKAYQGTDALSGSPPLQYAPFWILTPNLSARFPTLDCDDGAIGCAVKWRSTAEKVKEGK